jgi:ABC-type Fe3+-hydroxamate transport system substrate-binding protein
LVRAPGRAVAALPKVGGTKNPSLARVLELRPDLVIANQEENRERDVEALRAEGVDVWVTYPRTVAEGVAVVRELAALGAPPERATAADRSARGRGRRERARARPRPTRVFCAIWKRRGWRSAPTPTRDDLLALVRRSERVRRSDGAPLPDRERGRHRRARSPR